MKTTQKIVIRILIVVLLGAFFSFVFLAKTPSYKNALYIGYFYAIVLFTVFSIVQKLVASKLSVFAIGQQWLLKSFLYTISISFAYLAGLAFQTILLSPGGSLNEMLSENLWRGFVTLISSPFQDQPADPTFTTEIKGVVITVLALMFLIGLVSLVASYVEVKWQENKQRQALDKAELTALRSQIEPHFLFNSLNTIASMIKNNPQKAENLLLELSDILRYIFQNSGRETIDIEQEVLFTKKYCSLMQARFGKNLKIEWIQPKYSKPLKVPALILQPLIENALKHGWKDTNKKMAISIKIEQSDKQLSVNIKDDGEGIRKEKLKELPLPGHALANITERLFIHYNRNNLLKIDSEYQQGTEVKFLIPGGD